MADAGDQKVFASGKPTRQQLIKIKTREGKKLRIIDTFASHDKHQLEDFANMLLADNTKVKTLRKQNKDDQEEFIREVLYYWLSLDDDDPGYPRTWKALAQCVSDAGLDGTFAKDIRETYYPDTGGASTSKSSGGTAGSSQSSGGATQKSLSATCIDVNADNVLYMLKKYKFNPASWIKLATGLRLGSIADQNEKDHKGSDAQLTALINHWVANDIKKSWKKLVEAMEMSDHAIAADNLARDEEVGVRPAKQ